MAIVFQAVLFYSFVGKVPEFFNLVSNCRILWKNGTFY